MLRMMDSAFCGLDASCKRKVSASRWSSVRESTTLKTMDCCAFCRGPAPGKWALTARKRILVGPLAAALLLLAACGGDSESSIPTASPAATTTTLPAPPTATTSATPATGVQCGEERWPVKTLSDQDAAQVNFTPAQSSVAELRSLVPSASLPSSSRIAPTELTVFTVTAQVVEMKLEEDRDIHLVIGEPSDPSATMITEFPDADQCNGAVASAHAQEMRTVRAALVAAFGQPSSSQFTRLTGTVTLSGVGFFDFLHGQTGVAPNGIELHPVMSFTLLSGGSSLPPPSGTGCDPAYPTVCIPSPPPDLDCKDIPYRRFTVLPPDPHRFDGDHDGVGCES